MEYGFQSRLISPFSFGDYNLNFFTTPAESIVYNGTAHNVDVVSCSLRFALCDSGKPGCRRKNRSMKM